MTTGMPYHPVTDPLAALVPHTPEETCQLGVRISRSHFELVEQTHSDTRATKRSIIENALDRTYGAHTPNDPEAAAYLQTRARQADQVHELLVDMNGDQNDVHVPRLTYADLAVLARTAALILHDGNGAALTPASPEGKALIDLTTKIYPSDKSTQA
jgi:hypothetical protein